MTAATVWRPLTPIERMYADRDVFTWFVVRATGRLDLAALQTAYDAVCSAYPQLTARLEIDDAGLVFAESAVRPEIQIGYGDPENPLVGAELDQRRALSALSVVRDGADATVALITHHSVGDGAHSYAVLADLWSCYTAAVCGAPVQLPRHPYPRSPEDLLAGHGIKRTATAGSSVAGQPAPPKAPVVRNAVRYRLTAAQTAALFEFCHRERVTVHGLLSGAVLLVEAEVRELPLAEIMYRCTADLRKYLTPEIGATEGTTMSGIAWFQVTDDIKSDAVVIGQVVTERIRAGLADGSVQRSLLALTDQQAGTRLPASFPPMISISNSGVVPSLQTPDDLLLTDLYNASYARPASVGATAVGGWMARTYGGRLGIDLYWPEEDPGQSTEQLRRMDRMRERLDRMAVPA